MKKCMLRWENWISESVPQFVEMGKQNQVKPVKIVLRMSQSAKKRAEMG